MTNVESLSGDRLQGFARSTIKVQTVAGLQSVACWQKGALAIHPRMMRSGPSVSQWSITHMPSGMCFSWIFPAIDAAAAALNDLAQITNWAAFDIAQATPAFRQAVARVLAPYGEKTSSNEPGHESRMEIAKKSFRTDLNQDAPHP